MRTAAAIRSCWSLLLLLGLMSQASSSLAASTDCFDIAGNQIENCGFEMGDPPNSWIDSWGFGFSRNSLAQSGIYSASIVAQSGNISVWGFLLTSNCFAVIPNRTYNFGASVRRSVDAGSCIIRLASHADSLCADPQPSRLYSDPLDVVADTWTTATAEGTPSDPFARVEIICTTGSPIGPEFYVDDAFAAVADDPTSIPSLTPAALTALVLLLAGSGWLLVRR